MTPVRESARALRLRIEAGERLSMDEAVAACVTFDDAIGIFERIEEEPDKPGVFPVCCGKRCEVSGGWLGMYARCGTCGAEIRDALGPMSSPFLERGNAWVTMPGEKMVEMFGTRNWIVMHEGARP